MKKYFLIGIINCLPFTRFFKFKAFCLRLSGAKVGTEVKIGGKLYLSSPNNLYIGSGVWIGDNTRIYNSGEGKIEFEGNIDIGPNCIFITGSHELGSSTRRAGKGINLPIKVKSGTWIGASTTVLGDSLIGTGSVIAAGSVVKGIVEENTLYAGIPAIKKKVLDSFE